MTSVKQLTANQANAQRSTGPKTARGKKRSRANALKHGLTAKQIIVQGETPEQFEELRQGLVADFAPGTTIELELIDHLAALLLRRRRPRVVEAAVLKKLIDPLFEETLHDLTVEELKQLEKIQKKMLKSRGIDLSELAEHQPEAGRREAGLPRRIEMLTVFARYETHITQEIVKTVRLLLSLQERRMAVSPAVEKRFTHKALRLYIIGRGLILCELVSSSPQAPAAQRLSLLDNLRPKGNGHLR